MNLLLIGLSSLGQSKLGREEVDITLDLGVMCSSCTLGIELTLKKRKQA